MAKDSVSSRSRADYPQSRFCELKSGFSILEVPLFILYVVEQWFRIPISFHFHSFFFFFSFFYSFFFFCRFLIPSVFFSSSTKWLFRQKCFTKGKFIHSNILHKRNEIRITGSWKTYDVWRHNYLLSKKIKWRMKEQIMYEKDISNNKNVNWMLI